MAVDSKQGGTTNAPGTPGPGPAATLAGMPAVQGNGAFKRKRPSSLMAQASALPSVENSLDEFIAKANETLVDPSTFNADLTRRDEDDKRKEHDALRWNNSLSSSRLGLRKSRRNLLPPKRTHTTPRSRLPAILSRNPSLSPKTSHHPRGDLQRLQPAASPDLPSRSSPTASQRLPGVGGGHRGRLN